MNTQEVLNQYDVPNVTKFRVVYPDSIKYIRFNGASDSIKNKKLLQPDDVPPEVLSNLLAFNMLEVHTVVDTFWYVFQTPDSPKPLVHPSPMKEADADQVITLCNYEVLSKTPA